MAYGKIFEQVYFSSINEDHDEIAGYQVVAVFNAMIIFSNRDGIFDKTPAALARLANIPLGIVENAIEILETPDPESRNPEDDGRRIVRLDDHRSWGWRVVSKGHYRDTQDPDHERALARTRKRRQREREACNCGIGVGTEDTPHAPECHVVTSRMVTAGHGRSRHTDADTDTDTDGREEDFCPEHVFPTKQGDWLLSKKKVEEWVGSFNGLDVRNELRHAKQWLLDNPGKQKTTRGMTRFLGGWLKRAVSKPSPTWKGASPEKADRFEEMEREASGR